MKHYAHLIKLALLSAISFNAVADEDFHLKPLQLEPDINSVDLLTGKYYPKLPTLSIPAAPRLTFETLQKFDSKIIGTLYPAVPVGELTEPRERRETYSLTYGGRTSEFFECLSYNCIAANNTGSKLLGNMNGDSFLYRQGSTGITVNYNLESSFIDYTSDPYSDKSYQGTWYASQIIFPDNEVHTITYDTTTSGLVTYHRPTKVSSSLGYELRITYVSNDLNTGTFGWSKVSTAKILKTDTLEVLASQTYTGSSTTSLTDKLGRVWQYTGFSSALGNSDTAKNFTLKKPSDSNNSIVVASATDSYAGVSHSNFVTSVTTQGVTYNYDYVAKSGTGFDPRKQFSRVTITGPQGYNRQVDLQVTGAPRPKSLITADRDSAGNTTHYTYTSFNRLKSVQHPEGNKEVYSYDALGNLIEKRLVAKPGSGLSDIVVTADYDITGCVNVGCYRPSSVTDAKGNTTEFTFDSDHGGLLTKLLPPDSNGGQRLQTNTYQSISGVIRLVKTSVCGPSECGTEHEQITQYSYWGKTKLPTIVTKTNGVGTLSQMISYNYDSAGRVIKENGPLSGSGDATYYRYDTAGRKTWEIGPLNQAGYRVAKRYTYRAQDNQVKKIETGTVTSVSSTSLAVKTTKTVSFTTQGLPVKTQLSAAGTVEAVTQTTYDSRNRETCTATRMNPSQFGSLPSSACSLDTTGSFGQDRIVRKYYDALSRLTKQISGYATSAAGIDVEISYTDNGQMATRADGNGNITRYSYNGRDRLRRTTFPDNSYEQNSYDANGNRTSWRKRDGKVFTDYYDAVNLKTHTAVPSESNIYYSYDGLGRQTQVSRSGSATVSSSYDGLGRLKTSTTAGRTLTYAYDNADRRTRLTYPDGYYVTYSYDSSGALTSLKENGQNELAGYTYDSLGRMQRLDRGNGVDSTMAYDAPGRVSSFNHLGVNNANFDYNPASQLISRVVSNANFEVQLPSAGTQSYSKNSLNQYTQVAGKSITYDSNGNLKSYDGWSYNYNAHNRLISATKSGKNLALGYDASGRLYSSTYNGTQTRFLYDGDELVAEYNSSGTLLRRYVHGVGTDDPLVQYNGSGTGNKVYLLADERGSIIAELGNSQVINKYGPYGEPMNTNGSRFRYTGQILLPGTELYHYKARVYHPKLGRFMQTDPIGYKDGMNWYAYVGNDPVNLVDPLGTYARGRGWKNKDWEIFDDAQKQVAKDMSSAAASLREKAGSLGDGEKNSDGYSASELNSMADKLEEGASFLNSDSIDAHAVDTFDNPDRLARADTHPRGMTVAVGHPAFGDKKMMTWMAGHESLHHAGLSDQKQVKTAYKFGGQLEKLSFENLSPRLRFINPDHIMSQVYP
ncbi:MAG: RHS repeat-associated core domain-containing protein [Idiomarina sp.]